MKTTKSSLTLLPAFSAGLFSALAVPATAVPASQAHDMQARGGVAGSKIGETVSIEAFYGTECPEIGTDVSGATVRYTIWNDECDALDGGRLAPGLFVLVRGEYGSECSFGDFLFWSACVGEEIRIKFNNVVSAFVRAEIGLSIAYADTDLPARNTTDTDAGFAYGVGFGLQFDITEQHGVIFTADYLGLTARPSFDIDGTEMKLDRPEYVLFSIGHKYTY